MKIAYLADHPEFLQELAQLHHAEWSYLHPGETIEDKKQYLKSNCGRGGVPSFIIGLEDAELIGSASLVEQDMDNRAELTPWLADVFVKPEYRGRGFATSLIRRIEDEARSAGIARLFLYTPDAAELYRRLGWTAVETCEYKGAAVVIMTRAIKGYAESGVTAVPMS